MLDLSEKDGSIVLSAAALVVTAEVIQTGQKRESKIEQKFMANYE
jgi:hypothetical protein